jgi:hypothetical protein
VTNKTYLILQLDTEGDDSPTPLYTFPTKEQALAYIYKRVALQNNSNLHRNAHRYDYSGRTHSFDPLYINSLQIEELVEPTPIYASIIPVWYVKVELEGYSKESKKQGVILKYYNPNDHLTYFPSDFGDIPTSCDRRWSYSWAHVFSKVSLEDAFSQAEAYLKSLGKPFTYSKIQA